MLSLSNNSILIDAGDGISHAILKQKILFNEISQIIITHYHPDHFTGIASLITQMKLSERKNQLIIYTPKYLDKLMHNFLDTCYLFDEALGFSLITRAYDYNVNYNISSGLDFYALKNKHVYNKYNVTNINAEVFQSASLYFKYDAKQILYTSDLGNESDLESLVNTKIDYLIIETTHIPLLSIKKFRDDLSIKKVYLTHISDEDEKLIAGFQKSLIDVEKEAYVTAYDGLTIVL